ncbi:hypothetical protein J2X11_001186 [Aeromicrobium panaciterrae]|uniref:ABC transporter permease n=1 Tax=Aeromicrobium panaciterrae TaxID=363861 RepID=A0ABU1UMF6_9ACTN|nr:ABC transporter permease subunit [Aeromicrobium panaciterrae]MDR7086347.1 hypothetical protein [Aeromicrobium panaciterrae]
MSTATLEAKAPSVARIAAVDQPIPMTRLVSVELRKMFNTRSGFWLMASIGIAAVLATGATILFAPDSELNQNNFSAAIGVPMTIILPMIAILSVTSEWSQRSGLTTFTLVPRRGRAIGAKVIATVGVGVVSMVIALAVGALGNVLGSAIAGVDTVWNLSFQEFLLIVLANVLGMMLGFMLGLVLRNSSAAIVGYFVVAFVLAGIFAALANFQDWFKDAWPWVDFNYAQGALYNGDMGGAEWAHLGVTSLTWLIIPTAIGLRLVMRSEVK